MLHLKAKALKKCACNRTSEGVCSHLNESEVAFWVSEARFLHLFCFRLQRWLPPYLQRACHSTKKKKKREDWAYLLCFISIFPIAALARYGRSKCHSSTPHPTRHVTWPFSLYIQLKISFSRTKEQFRGTAANYHLADLWQTSTQLNDLSCRLAVVTARAERIWTHRLNS